MAFTKQEVYSKLKRCLNEHFSLEERGDLIVAIRKGKISGIKNYVVLTIAVSPNTSEYLYAAMFGYYCKTTYADRLTAKINEKYQGKFEAKINKSNEFYLGARSKFSSLDEMIDLLARDDKLILDALMGDRDIIEMSQLLSLKSNV